MSDISIILFDKDATKIPDKEQAIIDNAIDNFNEICSNPIRKVKIIKEEYPKHSLYKSSPESGVDSLYPIPKYALTRYFPNYVESPYNLINRLFISKGNEGFMMVNLDIQNILKPSYYKADNFFDYSKYMNIYQGFEEYLDYNPIYSEDGKEIDEEPFPNKNTMLNWIEILCVAPGSRGKSIGFQLLKTLEEYLIRNFSKKDIVIGLDIAGTKNRFQNLDLKNYYINLGFEFPNTGFNLYHGGAQLAYKLINEKTES